MTKPTEQTNAAGIGWLLVLVQAVLLVGLVLTPGSDAWPTPGWLDGLGLALVVAGLALVAVASLQLGSALTPTPEPREGSTLRTTGLYGVFRHPIYVGVAVIVVGLVLGSGSVARLALGLVTLVFFDRKAAWEEGRLAAVHPDYGTHLANTRRWLPTPGGT